MFGIPDIASAGLGVAAAIPVLVKLTEKAIEKFQEYNDKEMSQMQAVQAAYKQACFEAENKSNLSTLRLNVIVESTTNSFTDYPIFLQMEGKLPVLYKKGFAPNPKVVVWTRQLNRTSQLLHCLEDMLSYICQ